MLTALELQPCHKSLADAGFDFELPSGVKCLVSVEEFRACIASTEVEQLDRRHVVVSEELEDIVKQVIEDRRKATLRYKRGSFDNGFLIKHLEFAAYSVRKTVHRPTPEQSECTN